MNEGLTNPGTTFMRWLELQTELAARGELIDSEEFWRDLTRDEDEPDLHNVTQALITTLSEPTGHPPSDRINRHLVRDLQSRAEVGVATYGEELHTYNGRDATIDLYEELLDAYQYAYQVYLESGDNEQVIHVRRALDSVVSRLDARREEYGFLE